jgi:hypothetical protein
MKDALTEGSACLHNASMPNILIRNIPPEVHARLLAASRQRGQSLQQYVLGLISAPSPVMSHAEAIAWLRDWRERMPKGDSPMSGAELVREARQERERELVERMGLDWETGITE